MSLIIVKGQKYQNLAKEYSNVFDHDTITIDDLIVQDIDNLTLIYEFNGNYTIPFFTENNNGEYFYFSTELIQVLENVKQLNLISQNLNNNLFLNEVNKVAQELNIKITTNLTLNDVQFIKQEIKDIVKLPENNYFNQLFKSTKSTKSPNTFFDSLGDANEVYGAATINYLIKFNKVLKKKKGITLNKLPSKYFNVTKNSNSGYNCTLLNNINLKDLGWKNSNTYIKLNNNDIFDGSGHNITISWNNNGIFNSSANAKTTCPIIKNLIVKCTKPIGSPLDGNYGGGIMMGGQRFFIIDNCKVFGNVLYNGGGICGPVCGYRGYIKITNSSVTGDIGEQKKGRLYISSGFCGNNSGVFGEIKIDNCTLNGNIGHCGVFGVLGAFTGFKSKISITNFTLNGNIGMGSAGIIGLGAGLESDIEINNVTINGHIGTAAGGVFGWLSCINSKCTLNNIKINGNQLTVNETKKLYNMGENLDDDQSGIVTGGIFGGILCGSLSNISIDNCNITGKIIGGGIIGGALTCLKCKISINNCTVNGQITVFAGGICGGLSPMVNSITNINNCSVIGNLGKLSGGIIGPFIGLGSTINITNSHYKGKINSLSAGIVNMFYTKEMLNSIQQDYSYIDLSGVNITTLNINNCYSTGEISSYSGGIINGATFVNCTINNCYSYGLINENAGGISGILTGKNGKCIISNCFSTGDLSGNYTGGICGNSNTKLPPINGEFNEFINAINQSLSNITNSSLVIDNCYSTGKILYPNKLSGGIIGSCLDKCAINNSYSTATNLTNSIDNKNTSLSVFNSYCNGKIANKLDTTSKIYYNSKTASTAIPTLNLTPITNQLDTSKQVDNIGTVTIGKLTVTPSKWDTVNTWNVPSASTTDNDTYPTLKTNPQI